MRAEHVATLRDLLLAIETRDSELREEKGGYGYSNTARAGTAHDRIAALRAALELAK